jgi:hypothetical protein
VALTTKQLNLVGLSKLEPGLQMRSVTAPDISLRAERQSQKMFAEKKERKMGALKSCSQ